MSAPVTAEELAEIERLDREATPGPWRRWAQPEGVGCLWKDALPPGSICLESTGTVFALGVVVAAIPEGNAVDFDFIAAARTMLPRIARDLIAERARTAEIEADRDALAAKIETMLRDEEDARALRIAEHAAREDVAGQLEALRAAVRAHRAAHEAGEGETVALVRLYQLAKLA